MSNKNKVINKVLLLYAMVEEAKPVIETLNLQKIPKRTQLGLPTNDYQGKVKNLEVVLVQNGVNSQYGCNYIGTVASGIASYKSIQEYDPDLVISVGTAGGFQERGMEIGDVVLSSKSINHDRRVNVPQYIEYSIDEIVSQPTKNLQKHLGCKSGLMTAGNSLDYTDQDMLVMQKYEASVKDMESPAIALTSQLFQKPFFALKGVTDIVSPDHVTTEEFLANLFKTVDNLKIAIFETLNFISDKTIDEL